MTVARGLLVLAMLMVVGVAIVMLREESAKVAHRIQSLDHDRTTAEQRLWRVEMDLAELRGPDAIRRRARSLGLNVVPPTSRFEIDDSGSG